MTKNFNIIIQKDLDLISKKILSVTQQHHSNLKNIKSKIELSISENFSKIDDFKNFKVSDVSFFFPKDIEEYVLLQLNFNFSFSLFDQELKFNFYLEQKYHDSINEYKISLFYQNCFLSWIEFNFKKDFNSEIFNDWLWLEIRQNIFNIYLLQQEKLLNQ